MNPERRSPRSLATEDRAAYWATRLESDAMSAAERRDLEAWVERDPEHRAALAFYCQFSADLEVRLPAVADGAAAERAVAEAFILERQAGRRRRMTWSALGGLAAVVAVVAALWSGRPGEVEIARFATAPAHRQTIALADGSRAELNARTALTVDFGDPARRTVRLAHGEALFRVAPDPARPFFVETPGGRVRVTGTVFNVRAAAGGDLDVSVLEGAVEVMPAAAAAAPVAASEPLRLAAGDRVSFRAGALDVRRDEPAAVAAATAWREGRVVFEATALGDALARFAAFHGCSAEIAPEVAALRVGGRYDLEDLDGFLGAIERLLPVTARREAGGTVRVTPRGDPR